MPFDSVFYVLSNSVIKSLGKLAEPSLNQSSNILFPSNMILVTSSENPSLISVRGR